MDGLIEFLQKQNKDLEPELLTLGEVIKAELDNWQADSQISLLVEVEDLSKIKEKLAEMNLQFNSDNDYVELELDKIYIKYVTDAEAFLGEDSEDSTEFETLLAQEKEAKLRVLADFQNYKKRIEREREEMSEVVSKELTNMILETIDDFKRAIEHEQSAEQQNFESLLGGAKSILQKLEQLVSEQGLEVIEIKVGDKFDPIAMEAIGTTPATEDHKENTVVHIDQVGYKFAGQDRVYRPAKVIISK